MDQQNAFAGLPRLRRFRRRPLSRGVPLHLGGHINALKGTLRPQMRNRRCPIFGKGLRMDGMRQISKSISCTASSTIRATPLLSATRSVRPTMPGTARRAPFDQIVATNSSASANGNRLIRSIFLSDDHFAGSQVGYHPQQLGRSARAPDAYSRYTPTHPRRSLQRRS